MSLGLPFLYANNQGNRYSVQGFHSAARKLMQLRPSVLPKVSGTKGRVKFFVANFIPFLVSLRQTKHIPQSN